MIKRIAFIFPLLFILGLAYWRYTYILNPNFSGDPTLIDIKSLKDGAAPNTLVYMKSIIVYWFLFFIGNASFFYVLFKSAQKVRTVLFLYLLLSVISGLFLGADAFVYQSTFLFNIGALLKNFLLSPMYTAIGYIVVEYFHWFGRPS